jgi:hypothetical protein
MLMNRVDREARVVAASFDPICREAVEHLETMYIQVAALIHVGLENSKNPEQELPHTCTILLWNALKSLSAAFSLLRTGWRLQPYQCLRNGMEAISVVTHLIEYPHDLQKLKDGDLKSTKTISSARAAIPSIGTLYGMLSDDFVHVGKPFLYVQKGNVYTDTEGEMWQCLASIAFFSLMLYTVAERLCYKWVSEPKCWRRIDSVKFALKSSDEMRRWRSEFTRIYGPHYKGKLPTA